MHHGLCPHRSGPNSADHRRIGLGLNYISPGKRPGTSSSNLRAGSTKVEPRGRTNPACGRWTGKHDAHPKPGWRTRTRDTASAPEQRLSDVSCWSARPLIAPSMRTCQHSSKVPDSDISSNISNSGVIALLTDGVSSIGARPRSRPPPAQHHRDADDDSILRNAAVTWAA
jgi:hypothetical protein